MNALASALRMTAAKYLAWEEQQPYNNEYVAGLIYAMSGARDAYVTVSFNVVSAFRSHLRATSCRICMAEMKLRVEEAANAYFYPDVFVTCEARSPDNAVAKTGAALVVGVMSDSTAVYDRGRKFGYYRQLPSLQEYVPIDADARSIDVFRRDAAGRWVLRPYASEPVAEQVPFR